MNKKVRKTHKKALSKHKKKIPRKIIKKSQKIIKAFKFKGKFIETSVDELLELVEKNGTVSLGFAAETLGYPKSEIEEWAKALAEHNLIEIKYNIFSTVLKKKSVEK